MLFTINAVTNNCHNGFVCSYTSLETRLHDTGQVDVRYDPVCILRSMRSPTSVIMGLGVYTTNLRVFVGVSHPNAHQVKIAVPFTVNPNSLVLIPSPQFTFGSL